MNSTRIKLARITIYPIKSLDGVDVETVGVLPNGALQNDRRWAIVDGQNRWINGKRTAAIHQIRAEYSPALDFVTLAGPAGPTVTFRLPEDESEIASWLSEHFGFDCRLVENPAGGLPDDDEAPGPTLLSAASLAEVAGWFDGLDAEDVHRRIRANLVVDAAEPFWEDRLGDDGVASPQFSLGSVAFRGRTICQRCIVPTRDAHTGEPTAAFARIFADERQRRLPAWAPAVRFDHYYRLALNTSAARVAPGAVIRVGDELQLTP